MNKKTLIVVVTVFISVLLAIVVKSFLPAEVNIDDFNSKLVEWVGFPIVATLYFIILYAHCVIVLYLLLCQ